MVDITYDSMNAIENGVKPVKANIIEPKKVILVQLVTLLAPPFEPSAGYVYIGDSLLGC